MDRCAHEPSPSALLSAVLSVYPPRRYETRESAFEAAAARNLGFARILTEIRVIRRYSLNTISGCASEFAARDHTAAFSGTARAQDLGKETRRHAGTRCECLDWSDAARRPALHARPRPPAARALGRPSHSGSRESANPPALAPGAPRRLQLRGYTAIGALYRPERTCGEGIACWTGFRRRCC